MWVRSATEADLQAVHELLVETWHATFDDILGRETVDAVTGRWHSIAALKANLKRPYSEFVVADNGEGGIDGMAFASQSEDGAASLHQLYVRPETQVQGIGTMLLAEVEMAPVRQLPSPCHHCLSTISGAVCRLRINSVAPRTAVKQGG